jgi:hypothetical protein
MTEDITVIQVVVTLLLAGEVVGRFRELLVDEARDRLFAIRDDLFDRAAAGEFRFDDPEYRACRETVNSSIFAADQTTKVSILPFLLAYRPDRTTITSIQNPALARVRDEAADVGLSLLRKRSPWLWVILVAVAVHRMGRTPRVEVRYAEGVMRDVARAGATHEGAPSFAA